MRRNQFTVNAESVQGIAGATVTFKAITVGAFREYRDTPMTDHELVSRYIVDWSGFVDDEGHPLPSPKDQPDILLKLYMHEERELGNLLMRGPDVMPEKN